ncbi:MAG: sigma-54-dependent transcriptional regulator [Planctomycetota bacterium]
MTTSPRVLVVDDEALVRESLGEILRADGFRPAVASGGRDALKQLDEETFDAIVTDLRMPTGSGLELLAEIQQRGIATPVIVITGVGTVAEAVAAMKSGAFDFLQKPVDPEELVLLVKRAVEHGSLLAEVERLRTTVEDLRGPRSLAGTSTEITQVRSLIAQVAPTDATVLVTGESGTGKELAAELVHRQSARASQELVWLDCAAVTDELFDSELFGHKKGALSGALSDRTGKFAQADGGTLVLDEVGALRLEQQAKLLRVLETGEYQVLGEPRARRADVRIVATTNEDLAAKSKAGAFRSDLLYRLKVFPIAMPALRDRKQDLPALVAHLLTRARAAGSRTSGSRTDAAQGRAAAASIPRDALEVLASYGWPGNVRELSNALERAEILAGGGVLSAELFASILEAGVPSTPRPAATEFHLRSNLDAAEREIVLRSLAHSRGKKKEAANLLGIDPRNLGYYLRKHKITDKEAGEAAGR